MAEITKHARYARQADFDERLADGLINGSTICFIEDTRQIYVNGSYYTMDDAELAEKLGGYATKEELAGYLPLAGGTVAGELNVNSQTVINGDFIVSGEVEITNDSGKLAVSIDSDAATTVHGDMLLAFNEDMPGEYMLNCDSDGKVRMTAMSNIDDWVSRSGDVVDGEIIVRGELEVDGETTLNLTENTDAPSVVVADDDGKLYKAPKSEIGGGDGKYLPISGGTVDGSLIVNERLTAHGYTTLNDTVTFGGAAYINLNGENRITVGGDARDSFPEFASDFWDNTYGTMLLVVGGGMVHGVLLNELAQWIVEEVVGSGGGTTSVFWHLASYDWEISLRNSAEETLGSPVELGLIFADNPYTGLEAQSCPNDCSIVWAQLRSSVPMDYVDDADGGISLNLDFAKRWFVGFAVRAEALFDVSLHISVNTGVDSWDASGSASRVGASGSSEWGFVPADAPVDLAALDLTGDGATFQPIVTGEMVMREVN